MRRPLAFAAAMLAACISLMLPGAASAESRVALIIANSRYAAFDKLSNPAADAHLVEAALRKAGFDKVTVLEDLGLVAMNKALQEFGNEADHADVALVYYAGHGVEVDHVNYIVPVDVAFAHDRDVDIEAVKLDRMLSVTENAKRLRIVILDACRDNPFFDKLKKSMAQAGSVSKGMTAVEPSKNSLVIYSAKAGTLASDGRVNSPFAEALAKRIVEPGREISLLLRQVRDDVLDRTAGKQEPFTYGSLSSQEFYFIPPVAVAVAPAAPVLDIEAETWALCKNSLTRAPCDAYLASYASGRFAPLVQTRVADITHSASAVAAAANLAANVAAARAASVAATNAANLAATYAATLAASSPDAVAASTASTGSAGIAARSTSLGAAGGASSFPSSAPVVFAAPSPPPPSTPVVAAPVTVSAPVFVAPPAAASAPVVVAAKPPPSTPVVVATSPPPSAPAVVAIKPTPIAPAVVVASPPASAPAVVASKPTPSAAVVVAAGPSPTAPIIAPRAPSSAPVVVAASPAPSAPIAVAGSRPPAAPIVLASLGPIAVPPYAAGGSAASARSAAGFAPVRIGDLGITVRYDTANKGILVESVERGALVSGKLFSGDLIMRIDATAPDPASPPDTQLAANWKTEGRLKLLIKRGDADSVVIIRGNN